MIMTESKQIDNNESGKKKMSLQEAINLKLESKKNQATNSKSYGNASTETKKLKSQRTKKTNNQSRRTGV
jgi:hypothetical protein